MSGCVGSCPYIRLTAAVTAARSSSGILSEMEVKGFLISTQLHIFKVLLLPLIDRLL